MAKDGKAYLSSLRDNRTIYIDGRKVTDVTTDSSFAVRSPAQQASTTIRPRRKISSK